MIHLDRYDGELWCGRHRDDDGMSADYVTVLQEDCDGRIGVDRIGEVECEACLDAVIAFGERCINRLEHLRDPGCGPDTRFGYPNRNESMQWRRIPMHMAETAIRSGEIERLAGEVDIDIERLRVDLNRDIEESRTVTHGTTTLIIDGKEMK